MAISIGAAFVSTFATTATVGAASLAFGGTLAFLGTSAFAMAASHFLVTTAIGAAINALSPKSGGGSRSFSGYQTTGKGTALDHAVIYGKIRTGGAVVFEEATGVNNKYLHQVIAIAGHEVESFDEFYINGELLEFDEEGILTKPTQYVGKIRINTHLGATDQTADVDLVEEVEAWTTEHRLRGIAYIYIRYSFDSNSFPSGVPQLTTGVKGKKLYDPRTGETTWSANPALAVRDYLKSSTYGLSEVDAAIEDSMVIEAANKCDATDTINGKPWFTCNGAFTTGSTPYDLLINLMSSMGGILWYGQGKWRLRAAQWFAPATEYTLGDLRGPLRVKTRHSRRDNFNIVKGTFRGPESDWQTTDFPAVTNDAFVAADNGQESVANFDLVFTDNSEEARRLSRISLERNRQQITVDITTSLKGMENQVGDNIWLTIPRYGWNKKVFEVVTWTLDVGEDLETVVVMSLRETSTSVFDEVSDGIAYERDNTSLVSPFDVPTVGISVDSFAQVLDEKVVNSVRVLTQSSRAEAVDLVEVQLLQLTSVDFKTGIETPVTTERFTLGQGDLGYFGAQDLSRGTWEVRARAINTFGIKGQWSSVNVLLNADDGKPEDVLEFERQIAGSTLFLSWDPVSDRDLSYYEIRYNSNTSGATWATSQPLVLKIARPATSATVIVRSGTYLIKAWDKLGQSSENATSVVVLPSEVPTLGTVLDFDQHPTFSGVKSNCVVETSYTPDRLVPTTAALEFSDGSRGTYYLDDGTGLDYVDTGASRSIYVTSMATIHRYQPSAGTWDEIVETWDQWPSVFDQWTNEDADFADYSYKLQVSTTDDDPAGSPTWSTWNNITVGTVVARAIRLRIKLKGDNLSVGPAIEELTFKVEY